MIKRTDALSDLCGRFAAWVFVAIGAMITYEVVMRYLFNAPTIWAEELSRFAQIWATYLAAAYVLRHRQLIRINMLTRRLGPRGRRLAEAFSLVWIALFSAVAIWYGADIALESIRVGRASSTMLGVPRWMTEFAVPAGFALLLLQALVELLKLKAGPPPEDGHGEPL
jgi:TRAP-type C4-dicarboxylate transport system permease small subunit